MDNFVLRNNFDCKKLSTKKVILRMVIWKVMMLIILKIEEMVIVRTSRKKMDESA